MPGTYCFIKIAFNDPRFPVNFQRGWFLSNNEHLLLKDYTIGFIYGGQKNHLMMLSQGPLLAVFIRLYYFLELTIVSLELSSNLLVPHAFVCPVFVCFF